MIEDFFENEKEAIDAQLEKYFDKLKRKENDVLFTDFLEQLR